jgi:hypothetical protein
MSFIVASVKVLTLYIVCFEHSSKHCQWKYSLEVLHIWNALYFSAAYDVGSNSYSFTGLALKMDPLTSLCPPPLSSVWY